MDYPTRYIYTSLRSWEITDLLQSLFLSELLKPSQAIWIASPWISDIQILDNRANQLVTLEPNWANRWVTFTDILAKLIEMGSAILIGTRNDSYNRTFVEMLKTKVQEQRKLRIIYRPTLHAKGLLCDSFFLNGSMNFTYSGITFNEEHVQLVTRPEEISTNRVTFIEKWGTPLS